MNARHKAAVDAYLSENFEKLLRISANVTGGIAGNHNRDETAYDYMLMYVEWIYAHKDKVCRIIGEGWIHKFSTKWLSRNRFRAWEKLKPQHVLPDDERIWQNGVSHPQEEDVIREISILHAASEAAPDEATQYIRELIGMGLNESQVDKVLTVKLVAQEVLDPAERILMNMLYADGMTLREIEAATGIPRTSVHRMVRVMVTKIKQKINE